MSEKTLFEQISGLTKETLDYLNIRLKLAKIEGVEKSVLLFTFIIKIVILLIVGCTIGLFLSLAIALYLGKLWNNMHYGFLVISAFYVILGLLIYTNREKLITAPILRFMVRKIFNIKNKEDHE